MGRNSAYSLARPFIPMAVVIPRPEITRRGGPFCLCRLLCFETGILGDIRGRRGMGGEGSYMGETERVRHGLEVPKRGLEPLRAG